MADISMELIKKLRDRTGVGIGKCKEALEEANGDIEVAIANLRKAGMASAVKKAGRETNEGKIGIAQSDSTIALVEVNAETDFVVKNARFEEFLNNIASEVAKTNPNSLETFLQQKYSKDPNLTVDEFRGTIVQAIGENIQISRILTIPKKSDKSIGIYSHMGGQIVTMVEITGGNDAEELANDIAMHVAAAAPDFLSPEKVPAEVLEHEKEIAKSQVKNKPENIVDKIVEGKLRSFYESACLLNQKYIRDDKVTIEDLVKNLAKQAGKSYTLTNFARWSIGQK